MGWQEEFATYVWNLEPSRVIVCEDNDLAGRHFVEAVGASLGFDTIVRVATFRTLPAAGDIRDALEGGADLMDIWADAEALPFTEWLTLPEPEQPPQCQSVTPGDFYGIGPRAVLESGLSVYAKLLYVHADSVQGQSGRPPEGRYETAVAMDISENALDSAAAELEAVRLMAIESRPTSERGRSQLIYRVIVHPQRKRGDTSAVTLPAKRLKHRKRPPVPERFTTPKPSEGFKSDTHLHPERVFNPRHLDPQKV